VNLRLANFFDVRFAFVESIVSPNVVDQTQAHRSITHTQRIARKRRSTDDRSRRFTLKTAAFRALTQACNINAQAFGVRDSLHTKTGFTRPLRGPVRHQSTA
jgi:hypothetical protein